jgi:hypothetical protein
MEADGGVSVLIILLGGLIGLSILFWALRLVWVIVQSPVALTILLALLAIVLSLTALQVAN